MEWNGPFIISIHREVFGSLFPHLAGHTRTNDSLFGSRAGPPWEHVNSLIEQLVLQIQDHLTQVRSTLDPAEQLDRIFTFAARDHAEMLRIHPFIDGNGRWARITTVLFLIDCGLRVGTILRKRDKAVYIAAADRCIDFGEPGDLANLFIQGYVDVLKFQR